jgi:hypothetical protein
MTILPKYLQEEATPETTMKFARIVLSVTDYEILPNNHWQYIAPANYERLFEIYRQYCIYKKFESVIPLFESQFTEQNTNIIGYYHLDNLVAFSLIKIRDSKNVECVQFAWDYIQPGLRLGFASLKNECAIYKKRGYQYLYLGPDHEYKRNLKGYEILGPLS